MNVQNLKRPEKDVSKNLARAIELVKERNLLSIKKEFKSEPLDVVGSLLRSCFIAPPGKKLVICDLSAVENRVLGYIADDETILKVFRDGLDPYLYFAATLFNVPYESLVTINEKGEHKAKDSDAAEKRQVSKPPVLACGYQLSAGEEKIDEETGDKIWTGLMKYSRDMGVPLSQEICKLSVEKFRSKHTRVVKHWSDIENAAIRCIKTGKTQEIGVIRFELTAGVLRMVLPSGRSLHYIEPKIVRREWFGKDKESIQCLGMDQKKHIWTTIYTYSGKLTENEDQAISRDLLAHGMMLATSIGFDIVMTTHDEIVAEVPEDSSLGIKQLRECMIAQPSWGNSQLLLDAQGYETKVYRKD